ncbi:MAG: CapA family protein [Oscillospiraceae bacterium]|jgi:poly-gamma-glutamate synthesis protein (capsule biosynthesis protein)|nr:CapA family protein [Oscillospiraceae bacterium]
MERSLSVLSIGDLILDVPGVAAYFEPTRALLAGGDMRVCQVEVAHTLRGQWSNPEPNSAPAADPAHLAALREHGFDVATLGGNHIFDQGENGVRDTMDALRALGIATAGAGMNIDEARRPAMIMRNGLRIAVLEYNTVGPDLSWATPLKAGCAFLKVRTFYEMDRCGPGTAPTAIYTVTDPGTLNAMREDISAARRDADIVLCYFHMGRMCTSEILSYQREITHCAIDAGADFVACHHAHALLGAEIYRGKPIYYGLGHYIAVSDAFLPGSPIEKQHRFNPFGDASTRPYWQIPYELPEQPIPYYVFDEKSRFTMIVRADFRQGKVASCMYPLWIDERGMPVPMPRTDGGERFMAFFRELCRIGEVSPELRWSADGTAIELY